MPRKNPLPPDEIAIGSRVRIVREQRSLSRVAFARELGADSSTITNVEHGRVPLRFDVADRLCNRFKISHRWLATGARPVNFWTHLHGFSSRIPPRTLFSVAYREFLSSVVEKALKASDAKCRPEELDDALLATFRTFGSSSAEAMEQRKERGLQWFAYFVGTLPPPLYDPFFESICAAAEKFFRQHERAIYRHRAGLAGPSDEGGLLKKRRK